MKEFLLLNLEDRYDILSSDYDIQQLGVISDSMEIKVSRVCLERNKGNSSSSRPKFYLKEFRTGHNICL